MYTTHETGFHSITRSILNKFSACEKLYEFSTTRLVGVPLPIVPGSSVLVLILFRQRSGIKSREEPRGRMAIGGSDLFRVIVLHGVFVLLWAGAMCVRTEDQGASETATTCLDQWTYDITQTPVRSAFSTVRTAECRPGALTSRYRRNSRCNASVSVLHFYYSLRTTCYASRSFIKYLLCRVYWVSVESRALR